MNDREDLTPEERSALDALSKGPAPPPGLEESVVALLAERGLIARRSRAWRAWAAAAAAGIALFAAGVFVGARRGTVAPEGRPGMTRYVLLLYDSPGEETLSEAEMAARVSEYRDWAVGLRKQGSDIQGEKLASERLDLGSAEVPLGPWPLGGYFVFSAKDRAAALAVARSCPHLRHGGQAELRPIEET